MSWAAREWAAEQWRRTHVDVEARIKLSPGAKLVLFWLGDHENKDTREITVAAERLAKETGLSKRAIPPALAQLVAIGLIERMPRRLADGRRTSDLIHLNIPEDWRTEWEAKRMEDSSPEPTPTSLSTSLPLSPSVGKGSDEGTSAGDLFTCERCGAYLAADQTESICSPCQLDETRMAVAA